MLTRCELLLDEGSSLVLAELECFEKAFKKKFPEIDLYVADMDGRDADDAIYDLFCKCGRDKSKEVMEVVRDNFPSEYLLSGGEKVPKGYHKFDHTTFKVEVEEEDVILALLGELRYPEYSKEELEITN